MKIEATNVHGCYTISLTEHVDERGSFSRSFCPHELKAAGVPFDFNICQTNISQNTLRGTLRGMHWQATPKADGKIIRVVRGAMFDVAADIRPNSPTYGQWTSQELTAENHKAILIPPGCAHGIITLVDDTEFHYLMGEFYDEPMARGMRWNDPMFKIDWPLEPIVISERDATYPDFVAE